MDHLLTRRPMRLPEYDYGANGAYFVTVCTEGKRCILGHVVGGGVLDAPYTRLSEYGIAAEKTLLEMSAFYKDVAIEKYVIMPNHVHFIISINACGGPSRTPAPANARLPAFISTWKRFTNKKAGFLSGSATITTTSSAPRQTISVSGNTSTKTPPVGRRTNTIPNNDKEDIPCLKKCIPSPSNP